MEKYSKWIRKVASLVKIFLEYRRIWSMHSLALIQPTMKSFHINREAFFAYTL